jgi:maltooligosyltrehalose trehalohydrolase
MPTRPATAGGFGSDAIWVTITIAVHSLLTGERGLLREFPAGGPRRATGADYLRWSFSPYRNRRHGNSPTDLEPWRFVVCCQNHDQVGNRARGERLSSLFDWESLKLAAGLVLLSPHIPLLFMGEEYNETAPFLYFVSHGDPALIEAVRRGRREEFARFTWEGEVGP